MPITWNDKADAKLLAGILAITHASIDFNALAEYMGDEATPSAVRHRITRLRAKAAELNDGSVPAPASPAAKRRSRSSPRKSAKAAPAQSKEFDTESAGEGPAPEDEKTQAKDAKDKKTKIKHEDIEVTEDASVKEEDVSSDF